MSTDHLLVERRDGVLYLTMNQPQKLNALSEPMGIALLAELKNAAGDREVGALVLTGAGRGFCAGGDVSRMSERNERAAAHDGDHGLGLEARIAGLRAREEISVLLHEIPKVTIAAVNGPAAGAGASR
jgi:2-(1,2-epoxy-1,2-dihydrophenyl)acetyl-CoA isomerase